MFKQHLKFSSTLLKTCSFSKTCAARGSSSTGGRIIIRNFKSSLSLLNSTTTSNSKPTTTTTTSNSTENTSDHDKHVILLDPETSTFTLSNGKNLRVALKETQEKVSRITQTFRTLLQNAWIFKAFSIIFVLALLVVEEYMKFSRVQQEFTTEISDEESEHYARSIERKKEEEELEEFALHSVNQYSMIYGQR